MVLIAWGVTGSAQECSRSGVQAKLRASAREADVFLAYLRCRNRTTVKPRLGVSTGACAPH